MRKVVKWGCEINEKKEENESKVEILLIVTASLNCIV